jgi:hypothetical protein
LNSDDEFQAIAIRSPFSYNWECIMTTSETVTESPSDLARKVSADVLAACPFSIAQEYAEDYFRSAEAGHDEAEVRVPIRFLPTVISRRVELRFGIHSDGTETGRTHDEIRVRWSSGTWLLPAFHGTVRLRISGLATRVMVEGSYHAPFGVIGRVFDSLAGTYIARASVDDLAHRIAAYLEEREIEWRARLPIPT